MSSIHVLREYMTSCRQLAVYTAPAALTEDQAEAALAAAAAEPYDSNAEAWAGDCEDSESASERQAVADAWAASLSDPAEYRRRVVRKFMFDFPQVAAHLGGGDETFKFLSDLLSDVS